MENLINDFTTTLNGAINDVTTSIVVAANTSPANQENFRIRIDDELMLVTANASTTWTVTRGVEGTTAASHLDAAEVSIVLTAAGLEQWGDDRYAADLTAHLNDTTDAHDASAISIADAGGYTAETDVEAALQEIYGDLDALTASSIPVVDSAGYYASTDVESALAEVRRRNRNRIIGGDFGTNPWQRNTTFTAVASLTYTADRFRLAYSNDGVRTVQKTADAPTADEAGVYSTSCFHHDVTTADATIGAAQYEQVLYQAEGYDIADLGFGQSGTRYVTLSFWVKATVTGTYCVLFGNGAADRRYIATYTVNSADTWEKKVITIPVDTSGTWLYTNGVGLFVAWVLACGTDGHGSAGSWQASSAILSTSAQVNGLSSTSNNFKLALVQLEAGQAATPFEWRSAQEVLTQCQRYYEKTYPQGVNPGTAIGANYGGVVGSGHSTANSAFRYSGLFQVPKRASPTFTTYDMSGNANKFSYYAGAAWNANGAWTVGPTGVANGFFVGHSTSSTETQFAYTADAEL